MSQNRTPSEGRPGGLTQIECSALNRTVVTIGSFECSSVRQKPRKNDERILVPGLIRPPAWQAKDPVNDNKESVDITGQFRHGSYRTTAAWASKGTLEGPGFSARCEEIQSAEHVGQGTSMYRIFGEKTLCRVKPTYLHYRRVPSVTCYLPIAPEDSHSRAASTE